MLRKKIGSARKSARSAQEAERSERVRRAGDTVLVRRKGLLASLAEGPGTLTETPSRRQGPEKMLVKKK